MTPDRRQAKRANRAVYGAIRDGRLVIKSCEVCGLEPGKVNSRQRIVAHHPRGYGDEHALDVGSSQT